jgi:hypothetical protein
MLSEADAPGIATALAKSESIGATVGSGASAASGCALAAGEGPSDADPGAALVTAEIATSCAD